LAHLFRVFSVALAPKIMLRFGLLVGVVRTNGAKDGNFSDVTSFSSRLLQTSSAPSCEYRVGDDGFLPCFPGDSGSLCGAGREQSPVNIVTADASTSFWGDNMCSGFDASVGGHGSGHSHIHRRLQGADGQSSTFEALTSYGTVEGLRVSNTVERPYMLDIEPLRASSGSRWTPPNTFGHVNINGEFYYATRISLRPFPQHTIDGNSGIAELEIEHKLFGELLSESRDRVLYTSVIIEEGRESSLLRKLGVGSRVPAVGDESELDVSLDLSEILGNALQGQYFFYRGSLTVPPCSEGIPWIVLRNPITASEDQLAMLKSFLTYSRDPQPMYGRSARSTIPLLAASLSQNCDGQWSYDTPECWAQCGARGNWECSSELQSPININVAEVELRENGDNYMHFARYHPVKGLQVKKNEHGLSVANDNIGYMTIGEYHYFVKSFSVHFPSEHAIDGKIFPGELQIVHQRQYSLEGDIEATQRDETHDHMLIASIFFEQGEESKLIKQLMEPHSRGGGAGNNCATSDGELSCDIERPVDLMRSLGPALSGEFYRYDGSLTSPPCSENVKWFVFKTPMTVSLGQWNEFKAMFPDPAGTNRPVQPLGTRIVQGNSFYLPGEHRHEQFTFDYVLAPGYGRNRQAPDPLLILIFVAGVVIMACLIMASTFVNDDQSNKRAGGLTAAVVPGAGAGRMFGRPESANLNQV